MREVNVIVVRPGDIFVILVTSCPFCIQQVYVIPGLALMLSFTTNVVSPAFSVGSCTGVTSSGAPERN